MKSFYTLVGHLAFAGNLLLAFFLLLQNRVVVPDWLQVAGRMHPLLLHLPIGFLLLFALLPLLRRQLKRPALFEIQSFVLALAVLTTVGAALMGFILFREPGYAGAAMDQHKWAGIILSWMTYGLWLWLQKTKARGLAFQAGVILSLGVLIFTGHQGAAITHGEDFVLAPVLEQKELVITEETPVYEALIQPVFQQKCFSCHNERKAKGGLIMTNLKQFRKGGDNGDPFAAEGGNPTLLIHRLELPEADEEHMPPEGKQQLTAAETELIKLWVDCGADMKLPIGELTAEHPLYPAAEAIKNQPESTASRDYDFSPASPELIESLNMPFRTVTPLAVGSPALRAAIFVRATYEPEFLEDLLKVKKQLVELKLDHLPVQDEQLGTIAQFEVLEVLYLNDTDISGSGLEVLTACKQLRTLALSGTPVDGNIETVLEQFPNLEEVYVWNTALDTTEVADLKKAYPTLAIHAGYLPDEGELLQLSPPAVKREVDYTGKEVIHLKHNFPGAVIRYTVDGSEPDSLEAPIFTEPIVPSRYTIVKARAFCDKWIGSETVNTTYFPPSVPISKAELLSTPNQKYRGSGAAGLIDSEKGFVSNFLSPLWIGYRAEPFNALFFPEDPAQDIATITISYLQNMGSYIMIPEVVEIWAGDSPAQLNLLKTIRPKLPQAYESNEIKGLDVAIPPTAAACFKIVARPIRSLPQWHQGAGDKAWVFVDEVYFYPQRSVAVVPAD